MTITCEIWDSSDPCLPDGELGALWGPSQNTSCESSNNIILYRHPQDSRQQQPLDPLEYGELLDLEDS